MQKAAKIEKRPAFWAHHHLDRNCFRWWLCYGARDVISIEVSLLTGRFGVGLKTDDGQWTVSLRLGIASGYLSIPGRYRKYGEDREIDISFHDASFYWRFWTDTMSWSSDTPRWRHGSFDVVDFVLGRSKCSHREIETREVLVPMPESSYAASAKLEEWTWKRPRWFAKTIKRVSIDVPGGIPFEGKGENSWDCGVDATHGITTGPCGSIAEGVGILVGSVLRDRVRNGGYDDWSWSRP